MDKEIEIKDEIIQLNISGVIYTGKKSTFIQPIFGDEKHLLNSILTTHYEISEKDKDGNIYIDYPSKYVIPIIDYIKSGFDSRYEVWFNDLNQLNLYVSAAQYLGMNELANRIQNFIIYSTEPCFIKKNDFSYYKTDFDNPSTKDKINEIISIYDQQYDFLMKNNLIPISGKVPSKRNFDAMDLYYDTKETLVVEYSYSKSKEIGDSNKELLCIMYPIGVNDNIKLKIKQKLYRSTRSEKLKIANNILIGFSSSYKECYSTYKKINQLYDFKEYDDDNFIGLDIVYNATKKSGKKYENVNDEIRFREYGSKIVFAGNDIDDFCKFLTTSTDLCFDVSYDINTEKMEVKYEITYVLSNVVTLLKITRKLISSHIKSIMNPQIITRGHIKTELVN